MVWLLICQIPAAGNTSLSLGIHIYFNIFSLSWTIQTPGVRHQCWAWVRYLTRRSQSTVSQISSPSCGGAMPLRPVLLLSALLLACWPAAAYSSCCGDLCHELTALQRRLTAVEQKLCPDGWSRHSDSCYLMPDQVTTWPGAVAACPAIDRRAHLTSVHQANQEFLSELVRSNSTTKYAWVGGSRLTQRGHGWAWLDGTEFSNTNWDSENSQPNNAGENCICIAGPKSGLPTVGKWHDGDCTFARDFLCEIKLG